MPATNARAAALCMSFFVMEFSPVPSAALAACRDRSSINALAVHRTLTSNHFRR
jgi:hypothetical protein